jgi:hypothetical protein
MESTEAYLPYFEDVANIELIWIGNTLSKKGIILTQREKLILKEVLNRSAISTLDIYDQIKEMKKRNEKLCLKMKR